MATVKGTKPLALKCITHAEYDQLVLARYKLDTLRRVTSASVRWSPMYGNFTPKGELCEALAITNLVWAALERATTEPKTQLPREQRVWDLTLVEYLKIKRE